MIRTSPPLARSERKIQIAFAISGINRFAHEGVPFLNAALLCSNDSELNEGPRPGAWKILALIVLKHHLCRAGRGIQLAHLEI